MKITVLAGIAAFALTGMAQADDIVSASLTGTITYGVGFLYNTNYTNNYEYDGNSDATGLFGGANLSGQVNLTFSYDATQMSYVNDGLGFSELSDVTGDGALVETLAIAGYSYGATSNIDGYADATSVSEGGIHNYMEVQLDSLSSYIEFYSYNSDPAQPWDVSSQGTPDAILSGPQDFTYLQVITPGVGQDQFYLSDTSLLTPEPKTWLLFAIGLGGAALLKSVVKRVPQNSVG